MRARNLLAVLCFLTLLLPTPATADKGLPPLIQYRGDQIVLDLDLDSSKECKLTVLYPQSGGGSAEAQVFSDAHGRATLAFDATGLETLDEITALIVCGDSGQGFHIPAQRLSGVSPCVPSLVMPNEQIPVCASCTDCPPDPARLFVPTNEARESGVHVQDGTLRTEMPVASFDSRLLGVDYSLYYATQVQCDGPQGQGWRSTYDDAIVLDAPDRAFYVTPDLQAFPITGRSEAGSPEAVAWSLPEELHSRLRLDARLGRWIVTHHTGVEYELIAGATGQPGALIEIREPNGNRTVIRRDPSGALFAVVSDVGQSVVFRYNQGRLASLTDHLGRAWSFQHDERGNLTGITSPATSFAGIGPGAEITDEDLPQVLATRGRTTTFSYDDPVLPHHLTRVTDERGAVPVEHTYYHDPPYRGSVRTRRINGRDVTYQYDPPATAVPAPRPLLDRGNRVTRVIDREGNVTDYEIHGAGGGPIAGAGKFGLRRKVQWTQRSQGTPLRADEPLFWEQRWLHDCDCLAPRKASRPFRADDVEGFDAEGMPVGWPTETFEYNDRRQVTAWELRGFSPQERIRWEKTYDTFERFSRELTFTEPRSFDGNSIDAGLRFTHTYTYDARGNRIRHEAPAVTRGVAGPQAIIQTWTYNDLGQVTSQTDANGNITTYTYFTGPSTGGDINTKGQFGGFLASVRRGAAGSADRAADLTTQYRVNALGMVTQRIDPRGLVHDTEYNNLGEKIREIEPEVALRNGSRVRYETRFIYDGAGNRVLTRRSNVDVDGSVPANAFLDQSGSFDAVGNQLSSRVEVDGTDANDLVTLYRYDKNDQLAAVQEPEGNRTFHVYDERRLRFRTFYGIAPSTNGDPLQGYPAKRGIRRLGASSVGFTTSTYDARMNQVRVRDGRRHLVEHAYDFADRQVATADANGNGRVYEYDDASNLLTESGGAVSARTGRITRLLERTYHRYDEAGRRYQTVLDLDLENDESSAVNPGGGENSSYLTRFDPGSRKVARFDANGSSVRTTFDAADRMLTLTDPLGNSRTFTYDANSNVVREEDRELPGPGAAGGPEVYVTTHVFDELDRRTESHMLGLDGGSIDHETRYAYDSRSNLRLVEDAEGRFSLSTFDDSGRVVRTQRFDGDPFAGTPLELSRTENLYDRNSRKTAGIVRSDVNDPASEQVTRYAYDALDRLVRTVHPDSDDPVDGAGDGPDGIYDRVEVAYDANSNAVSVREQRGVVLTNDFDAADRLTRQIFALPPAVPGTTRQEYVYDALDRLTDARNDYSRVTRSFDALSRLAAERQEIRLDGSGFTEGWERPVDLLFAYDRQSNRTSVEVRDAAGPQPRQDLLTRHTYDALNRMTGVEAQYFDRPLHAIARYEFLGAWRVQTKTFGNGASLTNVYDAKRRTAEHAWRDGTPERKLLVGFQYDYDDVDNPLWERHLHDGGLYDNYGYNDRGELTGVNYRQSGPEDYRTFAGPYRDTFVYDDNQNRREAGFGDPFGLEPATRDTYQINRVNEYTAIDRQVGGQPAGTSPPLYDAAGNMTLLPARPSAGGSAGQDVDLQATWDAFNLLFTATVPDPELHGGELVEQYRHDPFRRRIARFDISQETGAAAPRLTLRRFIYDGWSDIAERVFELEDTGEIPTGISDRLERVYVNGRALDEPLLAAIDGDGDRALDGGAQPLNAPDGADFEHHYLTNRMGSVMALLDANESTRILESYRYNVYGESTVLASRHKNPLTFTARRLEPSTGLLYLRHRYLSATLGRFLSRDPAGAEKPGLYEYALGSPVRWVDPRGLDATRLEGTEVPEGGGEIVFPGGAKGVVKVYKDAKIRRPGYEWEMGWIQLEFKSDEIDCMDCRWLQFVYRHREDGEGNEIPGVYRARNVFHYYGVNKGRHVDSLHPTDPFYDAEGENRRRENESSIFDQPDIDTSAGVETRSIFDAYLICDGQVYWHVHWEAVNRPGENGKWRRSYKNIDGGKTDRLESWAWDDKLLRGYLDRNGDELSDPEWYKNPISEEVRNTWK